MKANVRYTDSVEVQQIKVSNATGEHLTAKMEGSTAVVTSFHVVEAGAEKVYADHAKEAMAYLEKLPFVQAVTLEEA